MCKASDFSSRSSFFVLGKCKHSPSNKKMLGLRPLASICAIRSVVYGVARIEIYLIFKGIPASPALRLAIESLYPHFKKSCSQDSSFSCAYSATIFTFPPNLPLPKGGYKLGERLSNHSSFFVDAPVKILTLNFGAYTYYFPNLCYLCDEIKIGPWLRGVLSRRKH